jgi:hypothetical protein
LFVATLLKFTCYVGIESSKEIDLASNSPEKIIWNRASGIPSIYIYFSHFFLNVQKKTKKEQISFVKAVDLGKQKFPVFHLKDTYFKNS